MWSEEQVIFFGLIFLRILAFLFSMAVIGTGPIPTPVKILLGIVLSVFVFASHWTPKSSMDPDILISASVLQVGLGIIMGLTTRLMLWVVQVAGDWIGVSAALNNAQIYNPLSGSNNPVMGNFYNILLVLLFFGTNIHHYFVEHLVLSFNVLPVSEVKWLSQMGWNQVVYLFSTVVDWGVRLALPIAGAVLLTNLLMAILARAVPQLNVFLTSLQLTFLVSLVLLILGAPFFLEQIQEMLELSARVTQAWR